MSLCAPYFGHEGAQATHKHFVPGRVGFPLTHGGGFSFCGPLCDTI
jgi:hypothetical protein